MTIRLGANPIGWSNDDLKEIGGDTPLETCLAEAKEAGFEGMEKGNKMPNDGAALKAKLAEFGMVFVGGWHSTSCSDCRWPWSFVRTGSSGMPVASVMRSGRMTAPRPCWTGSSKPFRSRRPTRSDVPSARSATTSPLRFRCTVSSKETSARARRWWRSPPCSSRHKVVTRVP